MEFLDVIKDVIIGPEHVYPSGMIPFPGFLTGFPFLGNVVGLPSLVNDTWDTTDGYDVGFLNNLPGSHNFYFNSKNKNSFTGL